MLNDFDKHNKGDNPNKIDKYKFKIDWRLSVKKESEQNNLLS